MQFQVTQKTFFQETDRSSHPSSEWILIEKARLTLPQSTANYTTEP